MLKFVYRLQKIETQTNDLKGF